MNNIFGVDDGLSELRDQINMLRWKFGQAKESGDEPKAKEILAQVRPLQAKVREIEQQRRFAGMCPIKWTHTATDEAIEEKIDPVLKRFAGEPDLITRTALLLGPSGVGKSTTMALALKRACRQPRLFSAVWFYARALAQAQRQYPLGRGDCPEVERATECGLLILDDLGLERDPAELVDVVHARYEQGRPTWTSSGLSMPELRERYGEAFVRRLVEGREQPGRVVSVFPKTAAVG
jgi:DNA replication protein DnaC